MRRVGADIVDALRILTTGCGLRVRNAAHSQRPIHQSGEGPRSDIPRGPGPDPVVCLQIVLSGRQGRALHAIAEDYVSFVIRLVHGGEDLR